MEGAACTELARAGLGGMHACASRLVYFSSSACMDGMSRPSATSLHSFEGEKTVSASVGVQRLLLLADMGVGRSGDMEIRPRVASGVPVPAFSSSMD